MNGPSDEMLAQRQLRAAEIALDGARRQRRETEEAFRVQQARVDAAEAALAENRRGRQRDALALQEQMAAAQALQLAAEQQYVQERRRRMSLEQQVSALRQAELTRDVLARQLAAEVRIGQLEGELELVNRHAAEFEYRVRMAAFDAFGLVRGLSDVVGGLLQRVGILDPPGSSGSPQDEVAPPGSEDARDPTASVPAPSVPSALDSRRLDAALERLRATTPPPEDDA